MLIGVGLVISFSWWQLQIPKVELVSEEEEVPLVDAVQPEHVRSGQLIEVQTGDVFNLFGPAGGVPESFLLHVRDFGEILGNHGVLLKFSFTPVPIWLP